MKPRILLVDDEVPLVNSLAMLLSRRYDVVTATSGAAALEILGHDRSITVIVSDMRMPKMDGGTFLAHAREILPEATRILLTGYTDLDGAIHAINDGQIFRFLTKPCPAPALNAAIEAGLKQHQLITGERELLEHTLQGSIKILVDVLAVVSPLAAGKASRIKLLVSELLDRLGWTERWQVEVAAMLSQLGTIMLPFDIVEKVYFNHPLGEHERALHAKSHELAEGLIASIPRLDVVQKILADAPKHFEHTATDVVGRGAHLLRVAVDYDTLESQGNQPSLVLEKMQARKQSYDPQIVAALAQIRGGSDARSRELPWSAVRPGMVLADDLRLTSGLLVVARGCEVTLGLIERVRTYRGHIGDRVRIIGVG